MSRVPRSLIVLVFSLALVACGGDEGGGTNGGGGDGDGPKTPYGSGASDGPSFPGTEAGAKDLLAQFLEPGADVEALTAALRPATADYAAVFVGDAAAKAEAGYKDPWDNGYMKLAPKAGQTELLLWAASSDDLKAGEGNAREFPGGYKSVVEHLEPGVIWYRFKFVKPGETLGLAFDGLVHVNGRWVLFPKPWRVLR